MRQLGCIVPTRMSKRVPLGGSFITDGGTVAATASGRCTEYGRFNEYRHCVVRQILLWCNAR